MTEEIKKENIIEIKAIEELGNSYIDYAMSVITSRAIIDVRDGLKPVHRRIIYSSNELKLYPDGPYKKSARLVGDVIGRFHPHGDKSVYDAAVLMTQPFRSNHPIMDGQGNFGSRNDDPPAAMRYTEIKLTKIALEYLEDLKYDVVPMQPNYDNQEIEPSVLPVAYPAALINGPSGIAVGMASEIPPHNLKETIDATIRLINNPDSTLEDIMKDMKGPDFPTKGIITNKEDIYNSFKTGRGKIPVIGKYRIETKGKKEYIVLYEFPYGVRPNSIIESIIEEIKKSKEKKENTPLAYIDDIYENNKEDIIIIDLKKDADTKSIISIIKNKTQFSTNISYNNTVLDSTGKPRTMGIIEILKEFIEFRRDVVRKRELNKINITRKELDKQIGLYTARSKIDEVIKTIRSSEDRNEAKEKILNIEFDTKGKLLKLLTDIDPDKNYGDKYKLTTYQAEAILSMTISRLTNVDQEEIAKNVYKLSEDIENYLEILSDSKKLDKLIINKLLEIKEKYGKDRLTDIIHMESSSKEDEESEMIEEKDIIITMTKNGYVKRTSLDRYREQNKGGKGKSGMNIKDNDYIINTIICKTTTQLVFFTNKGMSYSIKAYKIPEGNPDSRGRPLVQAIQTFEKDEKAVAVIEMPTDIDKAKDSSLIFITDKGTARRSPMENFFKLRKTGKIAIVLNDAKGNEYKLINVLNAKKDNQDILISTKHGNVARFGIEDISEVNTASKGYTAVKLKEGNSVINASLVNNKTGNAKERAAYIKGGKVKVYDQKNNTTSIFELSNEKMKELEDNEEFILTITENGYGKITSSYEYRKDTRPAVGIAGMKINEKTGYLVDTFKVDKNDNIILITDKGKVIRMGLEKIRTIARNSIGTKLFNIEEDQKIVSAAKIIAEE